ncbi:hypothetical protein P703_16270 [Salmonella enterica subsp. enterica serovar Newport str. CVM79_1357]|nr:hypothetical protein P702_05250 [Salmonella enterica subsp. enterica serovar Newport str. CVM79_1594]OXX92562.1 hypothetical protein P703_16270 [Salmonella enterica subsp. enterica serovar Newport str. CVM79_1357]
MHTMWLRFHYIRNVKIGINLPLNLKQVFIAGGIPRRKHFSLHSPRLRHPPPGEVQRPLPVFCVKMVQYFHQLRTTGAQRVM